MPSPATITPKRVIDWFEKNSTTAEGRIVYDIVRAKMTIKAAAPNPRARKATFVQAATPETGA
jgi:hypothetical protein